MPNAQSLVYTDSPNPVEDFPVEAEGLFEKDFVLDRPVVGIGREVGQVIHRPFDVVLMPKQHPQRLFWGSGVGGERIGTTTIKTGLAGGESY